MPLSKKQTIAALDKLAALEAENWNLKHQVGVSVDVLLDSGATRRTRTRSDAYMCASGYAVIFLEDVSGYYLLSRVTPVLEVK